MPAAMPHLDVCHPIDVAVDGGGGMLSSRHLVLLQGEAGVIEILQKPLGGKKGIVLAAKRAPIKSLVSIEDVGVRRFWRLTMPS